MVTTEHIDGLLGNTILGMKEMNDNFRIHSIHSLIKVLQS